MIVRGLLDFLSGFNQEDQETLKPEQEQYIYSKVDDSEIAHTLEVVDRVVSMEDWLFTPQGERNVIYTNDSLEQAIEVGKKVQELRGYMEANDGYAGVDLNEDVLKESLMHFLGTIEPYEFAAGDENLHDIFLKAVNTPQSMLNYIIRERREKLMHFAETDPGSREYAARLFEYDFLDQWDDNGEEGESTLVREFAQKGNSAIVDRYNRMEDGMDDLTDREDMQ